MASMTPAFCAKQLGHSIEMFLRTYSKWLDGAQNDLEMARFESSLNANLPQICPRQSNLGYLLNNPGQPSHDAAPFGRLAWSSSAEQFARAT